MIRKGRGYKPEEILPFVLIGGKRGDRKSSKRDFEGDLINMRSQRLQLFVEKGLECASCHVKGSVFYKERHGLEPFHFNLYAVKENKTEVLMTKDHIVPKSKGGGNTMNNYQVMCITCNAQKADSSI